MEKNFFLNQLISFQEQKIKSSNIKIKGTISTFRRFRDIWREIKKSKVFGEIVRYFFRAEYQNRGAIHWHCVLWIKEGTLPNNLISAERPRGNDLASHKLRELVSYLQIHQCRK